MAPRLVTHFQHSAAKVIGNEHPFPSGNEKRFATKAMFSSTMASCQVGEAPRLKSSCSSFLLPKTQGWRCPFPHRWSTKSSLCHA
jgi:hypothetical protein